MTSNRPERAFRVASAGTLPPNLLDSTSVHTVTLEGNRLSGSIPDNFFNTTTRNIKTFSLSRNRISGTLPKVLLRWSKVENFLAADNADQENNT